MNCVTNFYHRKPSIHRIKYSKFMLRYNYPTLLMVNTTNTILTIYIYIYFVYLIQLQSPWHHSHHKIRFQRFNTDSTRKDRWDDYHALLDPIHVIVKFVATQLVRQLCEIDVEMESRQGEVRRLKQQLINSRVYVFTLAIEPIVHFCHDFNR